MKPVKKPDASDVEQQFETRVAHDYFCRIHMSLILSAVIASGVITSKVLLLSGVHSLRLRYPISVLSSYLVFLLLVRLWIWYVSIRCGARRGIRDVDVSGIADGDGPGGVLGFSGSNSGGGAGSGFSGFRGGDSGGGGVSDSWDSGAVSESLPPPVPSSSSGSGWFGKLDFNFDLDDGWWVLVILAALLLAILGAGGYLVYAAPHILPEAAGQALLATTLTRISKEDHHNWMSGVLKSTWIPFVIVLILAAALGWEAHRHCPSAPRLIDVFACPGRTN